MNTQYPKCENEHERLFELYHECSKRVGIQNLVWKTTILLTLKDALITATNRNYCLAKDGFWFLPGGRAEIQETAGETLKFLSETRQPLTKNGQVEWDRRGARTAIPPFSTGTGICYSPKRPSCKTALVKADEIVVYCSDETCIASRALGQLLERNGYTHVLHYVGGLQEWEQAGYPLEGEWVKEKER